MLSPAHAWLFSPFDRSIGHFRRYTAKTLATITPAELRLERTFYLDSIGMLSSFANRLLLKQSYPTAAQIKLWDSAIIRVSRYADGLAGYRLGKTVVGVWQTSDHGHDS